MTARAEVVASLARLSFSGIAKTFQLSLAVDVGSVSRGRPVRCVARMIFPDTDYLDAAPPFVTETAFHYHWHDDEKTLGSLVTALTDRLLHEFGESVWVDGRRPLNPHDRGGGYGRFRTSGASFEPVPRRGAAGTG